MLVLILIITSTVFTATHFHICMLCQPRYCYRLLCCMQCQQLYLLSHLYVLPQLCCCVACNEISTTHWCVRTWCKHSCHDQSFPADPLTEIVYEACDAFAVLFFLFGTSDSCDLHLWHSWLCTMLDGFCFDWSIQLVVHTSTACCMAALQFSMPIVSWLMPVTTH